MKTEKAVGTALRNPRKECQDRRRGKEERYSKRSSYVRTWKHPPDSTGLVEWPEKGQDSKEWPRVTAHWLVHWFIGWLVGWYKMGDTQTHRPMVESQLEERLKRWEINEVSDGCGPSGGQREGSSQLKRRDDLEVRKSTSATRREGGSEGCMWIILGSAKAKLLGKKYAYQLYWRNWFYPSRIKTC